MTNASQPNSLLQGFLPSGRRVSLNLVADDLATLIQLTLEADSLMTASGITVREPGLNEPGMQRYTIDTVARRSIVDTRTGEETSIIDFYCNNPGMTFRVVFAYLNTPEQTADFEQASGLRVSDIPLYEGDKIERGASSKTDKYLAKTNLFDIVLKPNPRHDPKEEDPKKKKPKNLLAFIVGGNPAVWDRGGNTNVDFSRLAPPMNGTGNGHNGTNRNTGDSSHFAQPANTSNGNHVYGLNSGLQHSEFPPSGHWTQNENQWWDFNAWFLRNFGVMDLEGNTRGDLQSKDWAGYETVAGAKMDILGIARKEAWPVVASKVKLEKIDGMTNGHKLTFNTVIDGLFIRSRGQLADWLGDNAIRDWAPNAVYEIGQDVVVFWQWAGKGDKAYPVVKDVRPAVGFVAF